MALTYQVVLSTGSSLSAGGVMFVEEPLLEGQSVEHYGQSWQVEQIDDHQQPPLVTLRRLERASTLLPRWRTDADPDRTSADAFARHRGVSVASARSSI